MKLNKTLTALISGASLGLSGQAMAANTAAGTKITNEVTLKYTVGSVTQEDLKAEASFQVDNKLQ